MHRYNSILKIFDPQLPCSNPSGRIPHYTDDDKKTVIRCQSRPTSRGDFGTPIFLRFNGLSNIFRLNIPQFFSSKNCDSSFPGRTRGMPNNRKEIQFVEFEKCPKFPQSTVHH